MSYTGTTQIVTFIVRNPKLTREQFYEHWSTIHAGLVAPWAEKHKILQYRQNHSSGTIVPSINDRSAPNATGKDIPTTPQEYDGFVVWEVSSLEAFGDAFKDPYYLKYIEPDEHNLIDKNSFAGGIVATFSSPVFQVLKDGEKQVQGEKAARYQKQFEEFEATQKR